MSYVTIFQITQKAYPWWDPASPLIVVLVGLIFVWIGRKWPSQEGMHVAGYLMIVFPLMIAVFGFGSTLPEYRKCVKAYRAGAYSVVDGQVENFQPVRYLGPQKECFTVRDKRFCYSNGDIQPGFNQFAIRGGPIREGMPVRIAFYDGQILRLQVRADSVLSPEERSAYASKAEADSERWKKMDLRMDHMQLGFSFAAFLIVLCWNLDWRHYIRYWLQREPPNMRYWGIGFRVFFAACLVGAAIHLIEDIREKSRTVGDYDQAALYSLIWIGFFGLVDMFFRWRMHKASVGVTRPPISNA
jgi:hypothetical protein